MPVVMQRTDFHFDLPQELIAQRPAAERSASRLLALDGASGSCRDLQFRDFPALLDPEDLLVFNDTRVIPARLFGTKPSGGRVEILLERALTATTALAHVRASKGLRDGAYGLVGLALLAFAGAHAEAWFMLVVALVPLGDAVIVLRNGGTKATAFGINQHERSAPDQHFSEFRVGLDHVGFGCANRAELENWMSRLNALGIQHGGIVDAPYGSGLSFRDPDGIALEFFVPPG